MSDIGTGRDFTAPLTDELIESGADLSPYMTGARAVPAMDLPSKTVNIDFPGWVVVALNREADRIGIARKPWFNHG